MHGRLRNYGFWVSMTAFIAIVAELFGVDFAKGNYNDFVNVLLSILVFFGILNDPTTENKGYLDDKR
ncbi:holin [Thermoflavimicrobium daqui]|uniref:Holin n=2 Tax=Thermoflavimicrobium daqui TaxID=2137476 RepID=A0A364K9Z6_9BACL|nr:holin [Thermoflavimicrobium daqui]